MGSLVLIKIFLLFQYHLFLNIFQQKVKGDFHMLMPHFFFYVELHFFDNFLIFEAKFNDIFLRLTLISYLQIFLSKFFLVKLLFYVAFLSDFN